MSESKQPAYVPVIATDGADGGLYPAGSERWSATPIIVEPSAGQLAAGLTPGPNSWLTAQTLNAVLGMLGLHVDSLVGAPAFQWEAREAFYDDALSLTSLTTMNDNGRGSRPLLHASLGGDLGRVWLYGQNADHGAGFDGKVKLWRHRLGAGLKIGGSTDTSVWTASAATPIAQSDGAASESEACVIGIGADGIGLSASPFSSRSIYISTNSTLSSWTSDGTAPSDANYDGPLAAFQFQGTWYVVDACNTSTSISRLIKRTGTATWSTLGTWISGNGRAVRRIVQNDDIVIALPHANTKFGLFDGTTVSSVDIMAADTAQGGWRGAWNAQLNSFVATNDDGDIWTGSADGLAWSADDQFNGVYQFKDIAPHGAGFVVSYYDIADSSYNCGYLDKGPDKTWRLRRTLIQFVTSPAVAFHLRASGGRVYAARVLAEGTGEVRAEWYITGVNPFDRNGG